MNEKEQNYDVGIICGRFQIPTLHQAHSELIQTVCDKHEKVIIFLGLSPLMVTQENPLDFEARKQMILESFPHVNVLYIKDMASDERWSKQLDDRIDDLITPSQKPILYGGRDSFVAHYSGRYPTVELEPDSYIRFSGTEIRKAVSRGSTKSSPDFRAGVVWAAHSRFPTCYPTVDIAIFNEDNTKILLARKEHEDKFRFIGGFADPGSASYEADARREVDQEAHIEITDPVYLGSLIVDDWRYRREIDKIKTLFFLAKHFSGAPVPDDDICELKWFDWGTLGENDLMETHRPLLEFLRTHKLAPIQIT